MSLRTLTLFAGLLSSGVIGGFFFGWMVSAVPGLRKVSDEKYISTMQSINREIINPGFVMPFMVAPVFLAVASLLYFRAGEARKGWWLAAAAVTYVVGVAAVTFGANIPLNDELEAFELATAGDDAISAQRNDYEGPWNRWHSLRSAASILAFSLAGVAAMITDGGD